MQLTSRESRPTTLCTTGNQAAQVPFLPGTQPAKKGGGGIRTRLIIEYVTVKASEIEKERAGPEPEVPPEKKEPDPEPNVCGQG